MELYKTNDKYYYKKPFAKCISVFPYSGNIMSSCKDIDWKVTSLAWWAM